MTDLRASESDLDHILSRLERTASFADLMAESARGQSVRLDRKSTTPTAEPYFRGAVVRAWAGTRWVEAATTDLSAVGLSAAADSVERAVQGNPSKAPPPGTSSTVIGEQLSTPARPVADLGVDGMIRLCRDVQAWALEVPAVKDATIGVGWQEDERLYRNTVGARCYQKVSRVRAAVFPIAVEAGKVEADFISEGGVGGVEMLDFLTEENVKAVAQSARELLTAGAPPTGTMTVLLDPGVAGIFAHESFGHGTEADQFVRDRSYLKPLLGQPVGPDFLTIVDNGAYPGGWGTIPFDDEGNPGQRTVLVERGRFVGALHDRETASVLDSQPTGNSRRSDIVSRPFVRMTNTYVEPGDWTFEELLKEAKNGVILERATSGIEDPLGGQMQLKVKKGHLIENGEQKGLVSSMALSGRVLDFLQGIRGMSGSKDFSISPGTCGKGHSDYLPTGTGGTYLLSTAVVGPA